MSNTFAKEGVRLSYFSDFITSCGGYDALRDLTTTDVCNRFVKPMTAATKCSVCELLRYENNAVLAASNVFISHAWKYKFLNVVDAVRFSLTGGDLSRENDFVVWFDLFTNCQHGLDQPPPFSWWCNTFKMAIEEIGHTVMVLSPWRDPVTLTRAWCLVELYATADCESRFSIAMSSEESVRFISDMETQFTYISSRHVCANEHRCQRSRVNLAPALRPNIISKQVYWGTMSIISTKMLTLFSIF